MTEYNIKKDAIKTFSYIKKTSFSCHLSGKELCFTTSLEHP